MGKCVARIAIPRRFATQDDEGGYSPRNDTATELRTTMHIMKSIVVSASLALSVVTCSDLVQPAAAGGDKMTRTLLTDAPFPYYRVARVDLYVISVSASLTPDTSTSSGFVTLATPNRRINVLALQNGVTDELGAVTLPKGAITAVRMVIDTDSSSITLKSRSEE